MIAKAVAGFANSYPKFLNVCLHVHVCVCVRMCVFYVHMNPPRKLNKEVDSWQDVTLAPTDHCSNLVLV